LSAEGNSLVKFVPNSLMQEEINSINPFLIDEGGRLLEYL
jgi:hypothetical protein